MVKIVGKQKTCTECKGLKLVRYTDPDEIGHSECAVCPTCNGTGFIPEPTTIRGPRFVLETPVE